MSEISLGKKLKLVLYASIHDKADRLLCRYLRRTRHDPYRMTDEKLALIKQVNAAACPGEESIYDSVKHVSDLENMGLCIRLDKIYILTGDSWYFLLVREIPFVSAYEFGSSTGQCSDILMIYRELLNLFSGKKLFGFCREDTSYPLIQTLVRRGKLKILKDHIREDNGHRYHRILVRISKT